MQPLEGFVIGVTADRRAGEQSELLTRRGATVVHAPMMHTEYLAADDDLRAATQTVIARRPDWLVATTGIGVRAWFEAAQAWGLADALHDALEHARIAARGPKAASAVQSVGLTVAVVAPSEQLDELMALVDADLGGAVVAFQHFGEYRADPLATLAARGADVIEVPVYRWTPPAGDDGPAVRLLDAVVAGQVDALTFTSAPAVQNFVALAEQHGVLDAIRTACNSGSVVFACVGPVCAAPAVDAGFTTPVVPTKGRLGLLVRAVSDALQLRRQTLHVSGGEVIVQGRAVEVDGAAIELPPRERAVFEVLARRPGAVVSRSTLLRTVWSNQGDGRALEATIARLRRRLGPAGTAVQPVRGRGYRLDAEEARAVHAPRSTRTRQTNGQAQPPA